MVTGFDSLFEEKIDVVHIISGDLWAGAEVQVFHTMKNLKTENQISFLVILFNDGILGRKLREIGVKTFIIDESKNNGLSIIWKLKNLIVKIKPVILHVHAYKEHLLGYLSSLLTGESIKIFRTFHGISEVPQAIPIHRKIKSGMIHFIEKKFLNNKRLNIIAVSKSAEDFLRLNYPTATINQIYNAIQLPEEPINSEIEIRKQYKISNGTFWVGTLARLAEPKNLGLLIETGKNLKEQDINFKISIFGSGPLKNYLQTKIRSYNLESSIILEGFKENIFQILKSLDLFVLTSITEGLPMSLLEAMTLGTPVICTRVGGIGEVVQNEYSGLLVDSNDAGQFTSAVIKLYKDPLLRDKLSQNARIEIKKNFEIKNTNKKLIELYSKIIY